MKSIKHIMTCVALSLLIAGYAEAEQAGSGNSKAETKNVSAQEYLANSIKLEAGQPAKDQIQDIYDEIDFQRAVQAYIWAVPFANFSQVMESFKNDFGATLSNQMIWEQSVTPELAVYTPNNTTIYTFGHIDLLKHGAVVVEAPPGVLGGINNHWQYPLMDIGPFGPDKGKGGKFLILPPNYEGSKPEGYHIVQSDTYQIIYLLRGIVRNGDKQTAIDNVRKTRLYKLSQADNPPAMTLTNVSGKHGNMIFPSGYEFFELIARQLKDEAVRPQDRAMLGMLAPLGIGVGKEFKPDERMKKILMRAAKVGNAMARAIAYSPRNPIAHYYGEDSKWEKVFVSKNATFETDTYLDIDGRTAYSHQASFTANGMVLELVGQGSQYLATYKDSQGAWLRGNQSYRLHLEAGIPAQDFWSIMVYNTLNRSTILNGAENDAGKDGGSDLIENADGSIDLYFGPVAPAGFEENWLKTNPGEGFFMYFRAYGPTKEFFDKSWKLNDIQRTDPVTLTPIIK